MSNSTLRVLRIVDGTSVDGPGLRTSIYFAGCPHHCDGCHNPESWDPAGGTEMTVDEIMAHVNEEDYDVTFSGGDPLARIDALLPLAKRLHDSNRHLWCYTGYTYEQVCADTSLSRILPYIDILVDSPFVLAERDTTLLFRGSRNQRLVNVPLSRPGAIVTYEPDI